MMLVIVDQKNPVPHPRVFRWSVFISGCGGPAAAMARAAPGVGIQIAAL